MGVVARIKSSVANRLELLAEVAGMAASASGATLALVLGKLVVGVVLGAIALGFVLRLKSRRAGRLTVSEEPTPVWVRPAVAIASAVEVAALVEAANLPVRFSQEGFQYAHWLLLAFVFFAAYFGQVQAVCALLRKGESKRVA